MVEEKELTCEVPGKNGIKKKISLPIFFFRKKKHVCIVSRDAFETLKSAWKKEKEREGMIYGSFRKEGKRDVWRVDGVCGITKEEVEPLKLACGKDSLALHVRKGRGSDIWYHLKNFAITGFNQTRFAKRVIKKKHWYYKRFEDQVEGKKFLWNKGEALRGEGMLFFGVFHTHPHVENKARHSIPPVELVLLLAGKGRAAAWEYPLNLVDYYSWLAQLVGIVELKKEFGFNAGHPMFLICRDEPWTNKMRIMAFALVETRTLITRRVEYALGLVPLKVEE